MAVIWSDNLFNIRLVSIFEDRYDGGLFPYGGELSCNNGRVHGRGDAWDGGREGLLKVPQCNAA